MSKFIVVRELKTIHHGTQAKVTKIVGHKNGGRLSLTNLITFAGTQNGE